MPFGLFDVSDVEKTGEGKKDWKWVMRQTDFCNGAVKKSISRKRRMMRAGIILDMDLVIVYNVHRRLKKKKETYSNFRQEGGI